MLEQTLAVDGIERGRKAELIAYLECNRIHYEQCGKNCEPGLHACLFL